jgi:hypothetical protein
MRRGRVINMGKDIKESELSLKSAHASDLGRISQRYGVSFEMEPPILCLGPVYGPGVNTDANVLPSDNVK